MQGKVLLRTSVMVLCICLAASQTAADNWLAYHHDVNHTNRSSAAFDPKGLQWMWSKTGGYSTPSVIGNTVIATNPSFNSVRVTAFDLKTGEQQWTYYRSRKGWGRAAAGEGFVVFTGEDPTSGDHDLYVLDLSTGQFKYAVPIPESRPGLPTITRESNGDVHAYISTGSTLTAVELGSASGSVKWSTNVYGNGSFSNDSMPTIGGESVFVAGASNFYAFDRQTGSVNRVHSGNTTGGGPTVGFDAERNRLYVNGPDDALIAYDYTDNTSIAERWRYSGDGIERGSTVAIAKDGRVYTADEDTILMLDPDTGEVLQSTTQPLELRHNDTPVLSDGYVWLAGKDRYTHIFDAETLELHHTIAEGWRNLNPALYDAPGAIVGPKSGTWGWFIMDEVNPGTGSSGIVAYFVPEPTTVLTMGILISVCVWPLRSKTSVYRSGA